MSSISRPPRRSASGSSCSSCGRTTWTSRDAADLLGRLAKRKLLGAVKPEITESMIELNTSMHASCGALLEELDVMRRAVCIVEPYGYLAKQFTVFGQHTHVGCASGDDAVYLMHTRDPARRDVPGGAAGMRRGARRVRRRHPQGRVGRRLAARGSLPNVVREACARWAGQ